MVRLPLTPEEIARGERLGAFLRDARGSRSTLDVALHAGISPETLRKIESGRVATPAFPTIAAIASVLSLSLDELWAEVARGPGEQAAGAPQASRGSQASQEPQSPQQSPSPQGSQRSRITSVLASQAIPTAAATERLVPSR